MGWALSCFWGPEARIGPSEVEDGPPKSDIFCYLLFVIFFLFVFLGPFHGWNFISLWGSTCSPNRSKCSPNDELCSPNLFSTNSVLCKPATSFKNHRCGILYHWRPSRAFGASFTVTGSRESGTLSKITVVPLTTTDFNSEHFGAPFKITGAPFCVTGTPLKITGAPFCVTSAPLKIAGTPFCVTGAPLNTHWLQFRTFWCPI